MTKPYTINQIKSIVSPMFTGYEFLTPGSAGYNHRKYTPRPDCVQAISASSLLLL